MFNFVGNIDGQLQKIVLGDIQKKLSRAFRNIRGLFRKRLAPEIDSLVRNSPEAQALLAGELRGQLGVVNADKAISDIIGAIVKSIKLDIDFPVQNNGVVSGSLTIFILKSSLEEVLSLASGKFVSEKGQDVPWLDWLLTRGDSIILSNRRYFSGGKAPAYSRTSTGIMARGKFWRIPPQYSGTIADNWLTRALAKIPVVIEAFLVAEINRSFS